MLLGELVLKSEYVSVSDPSVFMLDICGVSSNSKDIRPGYAFVSIEGMITDGARYVMDSAVRGASVVVCSRVLPLCPLPCVQVREPRRMLAYMLYRLYKKTIDRMRVYAVTGTNGKTSTAVYLKNILSEAGSKTAYIGSLGVYLEDEPYEICSQVYDRMKTMTTPDPEQFYYIADRLYDCGVESLVLEASSHALKLDKLAPVRFRCGIFTNFSSEHLDFHEDLCDYLMSKCRLYSMSDRMVVNADDKACVASSHLFEGISYTYSAYNRAADIKAIDIELLGLDGVRYKMISEYGNIDIRCRVPGEFSVYNSLAACTVARLEHIDDDVIATAINKTVSIDGRLDVIARGDNKLGLYVIIDYAHTERALENLLVSVRNMRAQHQRVVTLFGCGGDRDRTKRAPMGRIASLYSDLVIVTEDNNRTEDPDRILGDILAGIDITKPHKVIKDRKQAIEFAINNAKQSDIILLVGKGHENYEINSDGIISFSEKEIVKRLLSEKTEEEV